MRARRTSVDIYETIKKDGLLSDLRFRVYDIIYLYQPITISEMIRKVSSTVTNTGSFTGRISELKDMGVIYEVKEGECPVTGRTVIFWGTTDMLPKKYVVPPSKKEKKKAIIGQLRDLYIGLPNKEIRLVLKDQLANIVKAIKDL